MPVRKSVGDSVFGATLSTDGALRIRATNVGKNTALSQIVALVKDAQTEKAPIEEFADALSSVFAPFVLGLSAVTFVVRTAPLLCILPTFRCRRHRPYLLLHAAALCTLVWCCRCGMCSRPRA